MLRLRRVRRLAATGLGFLLVLPLAAAPAQAANQATWSLINVNRGRSPSNQFSFGNAGCPGVTGDWDGNRTTTVGVVCKSGTTWTWNLINVNRGGSPSIRPFNYGNAACTPVTGDWDGNGTTTAGVVCKSE